MKVKICGLSNKEDAVWAVNYGADYLGFNFYKKSPRHCAVSNAAGWIKQLPSYVARVGVFVDAGEEEIVKTVSKLGLNGVQLHGNEPVEAVASLREVLINTERPPKIIKAFRVESRDDLAPLQDYADVVDFFLLDSKVQGEVGGTGVSFSWELANEVKELNKPIFIAGGLTPENVKEAIKAADPYGVDVATGVEKSPRRKDPDKIKNFIIQAKGESIRVR